MSRLKKMSERSVISNGISIVKKSLKKESKKDGLTMLRSGLIYSPLMGDLGMEKWISSLGDFHVRISHRQGKARGLRGIQEADCGSKCLGLSESQIQVMSFLKTLQPLGSAVSVKSLAVLPKQGMMRNGLCSELVMSELCTKEKDGFALQGKETWRTPNASDWEGGIMEMREDAIGHYKLRDHVMPINSKFWPTPKSTMVEESYENWKRRMSSYSDPKSRTKTKPDNLAIAVTMWPTPQVMDYRTDVRQPENKSEKANKGGCSNLRERVVLSEKETRRLNPDWVEFLMGYPRGYSDLMIDKCIDFKGWEVDPADFPTNNVNYIPRIINRKDLRMSRLKCLGNAVVLQQVMVAWGALR